MSAALVGRAVVEICPRRQWRKPASTYVGIVQESGTGKSPLIGFVREPIAEWEARRAAEEAPRRCWREQELELARDRLTAGRKAAVKDKGQESELEHLVGELARLESEPGGAFQLLLQDVTEEELVRVMAGNRGRAASVDPEGTILEVAAGRYGNGDARLAALTHGWDGEPMRVNRVGRRRVDLPTANLALLLGLQPGILEGMLNAETLRQRGVLARFLWIAPTMRWDKILTGRDVPPLDLRAVERYRRAIHGILDFPEKAEGGAHLLSLSPEAQEGVYRLEQAKVDGMRPGGPLSSVSSFAGKLPDHGTRVAALLTVADRADKGEDLFREPIPGWAMEGAERLVKAIGTHVVRIIGYIGGNPRLNDLRYLLDLAVEMEGSSESEIREKARARKQFRDAEYVREPFDDLEERGCLRRVPRVRPPGPGRDPSPLIRCHPLLLSSDKSEETPLPSQDDTSKPSDKSDELPGGGFNSDDYAVEERLSIQAEHPEPLGELHPEHPSEAIPDTLGLRGKMVGKGDP